jgi:hypothetical protein
LALHERVDALDPRRRTEGDEELACLGKLDMVFLLCQGNVTPQ